MEKSKWGKLGKHAHIFYIVPQTTNESLHITARDPYRAVQFKKNNFANEQIPGKSD